MATLHQTKICLFWYQVSHNNIPNSGTPWNNDSTASPDDLVGGIPFDTGACLSEPMYLTACGTGDAGIEMAFGPAEFFLAAFRPRTYILGWPNETGGYDEFDSASLQGDATLGPLSNQMNNGAGPGSVRSRTGQTRGRFFVQYRVTYDIFSQQAGAGVMRRDAQLNFIQQGRQNGGDNIGGAMVQGGNVATVPPFLSNVNTFGVSSADLTLVGAPNNSIISLAIALVPQYEYTPSLFQAIKLPDLICCPVSRNRATAMLLRHDGQP